VLLVVLVAVADGVGQDLVDREIDGIGDLRRDLPLFAERVDPCSNSADLPQVVD